MVQTLSPVHMRAVSSAIKMLFINLIGLGLGPLLVGVLSDFLSPRYGEDSLSVALAYFTLVGLWGSLHFMALRPCAGETANARRDSRQWGFYKLIFRKLDNNMKRYFYASGFVVCLVGRHWLSLWF